MPLLKATHIAKPLKSFTPAKVCQRVYHVFFPTHVRNKKARLHNKLAIRNEGKNANMKIIRLNKLNAKLKVL